MELLNLVRCWASGMKRQFVALIFCVEERHNAKVRVKELKSIEQLRKEWAEIV